MKTAEVFETLGTDPKAPVLVYCPGLASRVEYAWPIQELLPEKHGFVQFTFAGHNDLP